MRLKLLFCLAIILVAIAIITDARPSNKGKGKGKGKPEKAPKEKPKKGKGSQRMKKNKFGKLNSEKKRKWKDLSEEIVKQNKTESRKDSNGQSLRKLNERGNRKDKIVRMEQKFRGLPVFGSYVSQSIVEAEEVAVFDKRTGRRTQQKIQRPARDEIIAGNIVEDLEDVVSEADVERMNGMVGEMLNKAKASTNARRGEVEPILWVDEEGDGCKAFIARMDDVPDKISRPVVVFDEDGVIISEWDRVKSDSLVDMGTGPGGNLQTGRHEYDGTAEGKPKLRVTETVFERCKLENSKVRTIDLDQTKNKYKTTPFEFDCYEQADDEINDGYSALNDAHFYGRQVVGMFEHWYQTPPLKQLPLVMKVHYGAEYENAFWDGYAMYFGDGKDYFHPLTALDIIAHEVAHGVTDQSSDLVYRYQSGGINEAFSDMAAMAVQRYVGESDEDVDWNLGSTIVKSGEPLRCVNNPTCDGASIDHVRDYHAEIDVHHSSGIFNKVFYEMSKLLTYGTWDAMDIFYVANTKLWGPTTGFKDGAELLLKGVEEMKENLHLPYTYDHVDVQRDVVAPLATVGIDCAKTNEEWECTLDCDDC